MKEYVVGGYIRDMLLGRRPHDKDFVVVGATIEEMCQNGYKQVGKDFPVFLHPQTKEEYALARTERRIGRKHTDFVFDFSADITLYEDCLRRDFTCNALAMDVENGEIIDYFGGKKDIQNKTIRIIDEKNFKQDPLRILRAFRFAAVLDFTIESDSKNVLKQMIADGMLRDLTPERVWMETLKALQPQANSAKFFEGLAEIGGLQPWFAELEILRTIPELKKYHASENTFKHVMCALTRARSENALVKWAVLHHDDGKGITPPEILPHHYGHEVRGLDLIASACHRLKVPNEYKRFALLFCRQHMRIGKFDDMKTAKKYDFVKEISGNFRDRAQTEAFLHCFAADYYGEKVKNAYCDDDFFRLICQQVLRVYDIMSGVTLEDLPPESQKILHKYSGAQFGKLYREHMIMYLDEKLKEPNG